MELPKTPAVFVLLVVTDGARWLRDVLEGLRVQEHRPLNIVAIDNASSDGSGELLRRALGERRVVTLERRVGYGRALAAGLKSSGERAATADAFLLVHDDCALAPGAIEAMLSAMARADAGIVGVKLLEWDDPDRLQDIGQTTDRYGRAVPRVERGELDQGQHEGDHEVLYATSAALLIHRTVLETVGLFDLRYVALRDDLDFCWRARLAGFRTVVTSAGTARHASAVARDLRDSPVRRRSRYFADRNMIATLIKNYSIPRLLLALPVTILISMMNVALFAFSGRRASAVQVLQALQWNIVHLPSTIRQRFRAQHARRVGDAKVTAFMHHGATRLRAQVERAVEKVVGAVEEGPPEGSGPPPGMLERLRAYPGAALAVCAVAVWLIGSRTVLSAGELAGADLARFPESARHLLQEFASGWRGPGAGGAAPATPGLVLLAALQFVCFGSAWLAQRVLLLGLPVLAAVSMLRLVRAFELPGNARRLSVLTYAGSPLLLGAFGAGRLGDLVLVAAGPALLLPLARAAGLAASRGWRDTVSGIVACSLTAAIAPWALPLVAGAGIVLALFAAATGKSAPGAVVRRGLAMIAGALALLLPWSLELFRSGSPLGAGGPGPPRTMADLLGLSASTVRPVPLAVSFGIAVAALAGVVIARGRRRRTVLALSMLTVSGLFAAWAVARGVPWIAPRASLPLVVAAIGACVLVGIAFESAGPLLSARTFGIPHLALGAAGTALAAQGIVGGAWLLRGDFDGLVESGGLVPSFIASEPARAGAFRIAWIGGTSASPHVALSDPAGHTLRELLVRPAGGGAVALQRTVAAIAGGATQSGGRLLATFGARYVIVRPEAEPALADAVGRQVDLSFSQRFHGAEIYQNEVGVPIAASVQAPGWTAGGRLGLDAVAGAEPDPRAGRGFAARGAAVYEGALAKGARTVFLAQDFTPKWRAHAGASVVRGARSFGWATSFVLPAGTARVRLAWSGQGRHRLALLGELLIVLAFVATSSQRAARERGER